MMGGISEAMLAKPMTSLFVTLLAFYGVSALQKKAGGSSVLNPVVWAIILCVMYLYITGISYETYMQGAGIIHALLGPVTVALAVPLYRLISMIKADMAAILISIVTGCLLSAFSAFALVYLMGGAQEMQLAITSKSVTAPIAIEIANKIGTPESLAVLFVFSTNIPWLLITGFLFKFFRIHDDESQGIALGTVCHGLGVARAFQISEACGTYAVIGMSVMGILSGLIIPSLVLFFIL